MLESINLFGNASSIFKGITHSGLFIFIKFLLSIYTLVLLADIIMLLILRGVSGNIRTTFQGIDIPSLSKKKWQKIRRRLQQDNPSQYKVAILEADKIVDDILKGMGYQGEHMIERLNQPSASYIENSEDLKKAHQLRNRIIHETDFQIDRKTADVILDIYEKFLRQAEFLD